MNTLHYWVTAHHPRTILIVTVPTIGSLFFLYSTDKEIEIGRIGRKPPTWQDCQRCYLLQQLYLQLSLLGLLSTKERFSFRNPKSQKYTGQTDLGIKVPLATSHVVLPPQNCFLNQFFSMLSSSQINGPMKVSDHPILQRDFDFSQDVLWDCLWNVSPSLFISPRQAERK